MERINCNKGDDQPRWTHRRQQGAVALEFALVAGIFFSLLFGAFEMARVMWLVNAAGDATYFGARLAAVCPTLSSNETAIATKIASRVPGLRAENVLFTWSPNSASPDRVTVSLTGFQVSTFVPFVDFSPILPSASTTLPFEYRSIPTENPDCSN